MYAILRAATAAKNFTTSKRPSCSEFGAVREKTYLMDFRIGKKDREREIFERTA